MSIDIQSKYRKIQTRKTPYLDTFHAVTMLIAGLEGLKRNLKGVVKQVPSIAKNIAVFIMKKKNWLSLLKKSRTSKDSIITLTNN